MAEELPIVRLSDLSDEDQTKYMALLGKLVEEMLPLDSSGEARCEFNLIVADPKSGDACRTCIVGNIDRVNLVKIFEQGIQRLEQ